MTLLQRLRVLIGYDLSEEAQLTRACREHLDARARLEEAATRLKSAREEQQALGERLARLSADRAHGALIRQVKENMLEALARAGAAREEYEQALEDRARAQEAQKQCFKQLAQREGNEVALEVVREALEEWWAERLDDGQSWWKGGAS